MALYDTQTASLILSRMLARIDAKYDKRTGAIIFNATAPASEELALLYEALDYILDQALPDTAVREFLIRHCAARGIVPYAATGCTVIGKFAPVTQVLAAGTRFNCGNYFYQSGEKITDTSVLPTGSDTVNFCYYYLDCETTGEAPNGTTGRLIPVNSIAGLQSGEIIEVSIFGEEEEETEALRHRYYDSFGAEAFGGNKADYRTKILAMSGVAGCKIYPAWNGGGTVRVCISATGNTVPSVTLVERVQNDTDPDVIDPEDRWGLGYGFAPIGHHVTVTGASAATINIASTLTLETGYVYADVKTEIEAALDAYYAELNTNWMYVDSVVVRIAEINARILAIPHIIDINGTTLNGAATNVVVDADSIAIRGTFTAN